MRFTRATLPAGNRSPVGERSAPPATRSLAFVVIGCRATSAVLLVGAEQITARATGATCNLPGYYRATFDIAATNVPERAVPSGPDM